MARHRSAVKEKAYWMLREELGIGTACEGCKWMGLVDKRDYGMTICAHRSSTEDTTIANKRVCTARCPASHFSSWGHGSGWLDQCGPEAKYFEPRTRDGE